MLKPYFFFFAVILAAISVESFAQRIFWAERNNNRIMVGNLTPTGITGAATFKTGLSGPTDLAIDLAGNRLFYTDQFGEDIIEADLTTGAVLSTVITTGGMVYFEDICFSENIDAVFGSMNTEVEGIYKIYADNNNTGGEINLPLSGNSNDYHLGVSLHDGAEQLYMINNVDEVIYVTDDFDGVNVSAILSLSGLEYITVDPINNKLYFTRVNGFNNEIWSSNLDGSSAISLASVGTGQMQSIQVYPQFNKIYYLKEGDGIYSMNLNGTSNALAVNLSGTGVSDIVIQADWQPPIFNTLNPANNATGVSLSSNFVLTFDENVKISTTAGTAAENSFRIYESTGDVLLETIDRASSNMTISGTTVTINPTITLDYNTDYYILAGNKVISDFSGNNWVGIITTAGWAFTTEPDESQFYSIQNGDWNDPGTWSHVSHTGPPVVSPPGTGADVIIGNGNTVTLSSNTATVGATSIGTWIQSGAVLDAATYDFEVWGALQIDGEFLNAGVLSGTFNLHASGSVPVFGAIHYGVSGLPDAPSTLYTNVVALNGIQSVNDGTIDLNGFQICVPPTPSPTVPVFSDKTNNSLTLSWTAGGGNTFIVARQGSTAFQPDFGIAYAANSIFGSGATVGTGNFVVYKGLGNSVTITGLSAGTEYEFDLYSFSTSIGGCYSTHNYELASTTSCVSLTAPANPIDAQYCSGDTKPAITVNSPGVGRKILWYDAATAGNLVTGDDTGGDGLGEVFIPTASSGTFYAETYDEEFQCTSTSRTAATLTLYPVLAPGAPSADQPVCTGDDPTVINGGTASGGTGTYTYYWQSSTSAGGPYSAILGAVQETFDPPPGISQTTYYQRFTRSETCLQPGNPVTVVVSTAPAITNKPAMQEVCDGTGATFFITATGTSLMYQWQHDLGSGFADISNGGVYSGAGTNQLQISNVSGLNNVRFQCVISSGGACPVISEAVPLIVRARPVVVNQAPVVCEDTPGTGITSVDLTALNSAITDGASNLSVSWFTNVGLTNPVSNASNVSANNNAVFYAKVSNNTTGCIGAGSATITVNRKPSGTGNISGALSLCTNTPATFTVNGISNSLSYQWQVTSGLEILSQTGTTASIQAISGSSGTITVIGENSCGTGGTANRTVQVLISPEIQIVSTSEVIVGEIASFSFQSSGSTLQSILWDLGDNATSSEEAPQHVYTNEGNYLVTLEVSNDFNCTSTGEATIVVTPLPELSETDIKNVITANGDSKNSVLYIENLEKYPSNQVVLLDRWGVEVFKKDNYENDWDARKNGEFLPAGPYVCVVKLNETGKIYTRTVSIIKRK